MMVGNNVECPIEGRRTISFVSTNGEIRKLLNVLYVLHIKRSLLLVASITVLGHEVKFTKTRVEIIHGDGKGVVGKGERRNNLHELSALTATAQVGTSRLWHE